MTLSEQPLPVETMVWMEMIGYYFIRALESKANATDTRKNWEIHMLSLFIRQSPPDQKSQNAKEYMEYIIWNAFNI